MVCAFCSANTEICIVLFEHPCVCVYTNTCTIVRPPHDNSKRISLFQCVVCYFFFPLSVLVYLNSSVRCEWVWDRIYAEVNSSDFVFDANRKVKIKQKQNENNNNKRKSSEFETHIQITKFRVCKKKGITEEKLIYFFEIGSEISCYSFRNPFSFFVL